MSFVYLIISSERKKIRNEIAASASIVSIQLSLVLSIRQLVFFSEYDPLNILDM